MSSISPSPEWLPARVAVSALTVLLLAKLLLLLALGAPASPWTPIVFVWQDVLVAAGAGLFVLVVRWRPLVWLTYALLVAYVALNVPVAIVLGSPLTWTMIHAVEGALSDSIGHHVTATHVTRVLVVLVTGTVMPIVCRRAGLRAALILTLAATAGALTGPIVAPKVETGGLDRNAITALAPSTWGPGTSRLTHRVGQPGIGRSSPFPAAAPAPSLDLAPYRGAARGFNVVLVILESTAAQYLRLYGASDDPMPTLTALGERALVFDPAYAVYPESVKGLYATLCGRMPRFGLAADAHATMPCASVARSFHQGGYRTGLFHSGRFRYLGMDAIVRQQGFDQADDAGAIGGQVESSFGVDERSTVARMLSWIDGSRGGAPFFLTYLPIAGHHPYASAADGPFPADGGFGSYRNALRDADGALHDLLAGLEVRHLDRTTAIVVVGDHGEAFGQHRGNSGHTLFIYDENIRVPYLMAIPGVTAVPRRVARTASLIDTGATLRDIAGLSPADSDEGRSLIGPEDPMALFFTDYSLGWAGLRDGCWKYLFETDSGRSHLFDTCADPGEQRNLAGREAARVQAYHAVATELLN